MKALLILAIIATTAWAADPFPTRIPDKLALCYVNKTVSDRYRRMPASIDNLIALIRKVEAHPETALWSMGKMASTLIHRFRYDGIVDIPNAGSDVVPVVNERVESDKYKLQWKLVPGTANDFPESSLTLEEQCSLHWMLSWTVNHTVRAEDKRPSVSRSLGARELDNHGEHDDHEEHHEEKKDNSEEEANATSGEKSEEKVDREPEETPDEDFDAPEETPDEPPEETDDSVPEETPEEVPEEEGIPEESESEGAAPEQTDESTDDDSFNADFGAGDSDADDDSSSFWKRKRRDTEPKEMATQPLEMGIVHTKYGTVAAGSVLMGVAAGSEPQSAKLEDLLKDPALELSQSSMERIVESIWVATLAGDIAQTALLRTSKNMPSFGPNGVWNSTYCPREYKLAESEHSMLTNAEFYGGIDGLLMAKRMGTIDSTSYLKLSSLLEMYYSETGVHGDTKYRACNRLTNYKDPSVIDQNQLKEQSLNAALVLYSRGIEGAPTVVPGVKPADQIGRYVNTTISNIDRFINDPNNVKKDFTECKGPYVQPDIEPIPATYTDLTFVFDELADAATLEKQKELAATLASLLDIQAGGSRMEVASGKDGAAFFTLDYTKNRAELACKIASLPLSYKERRIGDALDGTRKRILTERSSEKTNKVAGANTRAIMFFTTTSITNEKEKMKSVIMNMLKEMPDVHLMFATLANPEELRPYAASFDKDIIRMNLYTKYSDAASDITKRLASVGARLPYSECKDISASSNATEDKYVYTAYLNPHSVQYFRIGTEHFFSSNDLYLRFKSMYGVAKFCVSTKNERPSVGDTCKSATAAGETVEFKFSQLCNKPEPTQCSNIYVAAASLNIDDNTPCADKNCHTPDQVQFTYTHKGMRCNSATAGAVVSHLTLVAAFLLALFLKN